MRLTALALLSSAAALDDGLALTPPLGWRSYNAFGGHIDQSTMTAMMKAMAAVASHPAQQKFKVYAVDLLTVHGCMNLTDQVKASGAVFDLVVLTVGIWPDHVDPKTTDGIDKVLALAHNTDHECWTLIPTRSPSPCT